MIQLPMTLIMEGKFRQVNDTSYARYSPSRQIYTADVYPFSAPDSSKIVVCGHETGLLVLWRGGNSDTDDNQHSQDESEDEEIGSYNHGKEKVSHKLDLSLGTAVLHSSFPKLPQLARPQETPLSPSLLRNNLVVAIACADGSIRVITLPLEPQSSTTEARDLSKTHFGNGSWGERIATIPNAHQNIAKGVSIAFVSRRAAKTGDSASGNDVLIASHSADTRGSVTIHRIPIRKDNGGSFGAPELWRAIPLASPAVSIDLQVAQNPRAPPKVLIAESSGAVRIFETVSPKHSLGQWSLSLFPSLPKISPTHTASIFAARWAFGDQAVAVLISDGSWGIWDIAHSGTARGISGARPTPFTISGRVGTPANSSIASKSSNGKVDTRSQLAPMTPATRKIRQQNLFSGTVESPTNRGGLSIKYSSASFTSGETDESLLFWYGDSIAYLPSLRTHWQNKFSGSSNAALSAATGHFREVPSLSLGGEARLAVSAFSIDDSSTSSSGKSLDILVVGDRSLTMSTAATNTRKAASSLSIARQARMSDQSLLSRGLLDIDGLDRMMDDIGSTGYSTEKQPSAEGLMQKRVAFQP